MNVMPTISTSSVSDISHTTTSLSAKMKRLQIEESLLIQSIFKCVPVDEHSRNEMSEKKSEFHIFSAKIKKSYREIELMFQDIKTSTSSKEILKSIDIDSVKRCTLDLENSIKTFKSYLHSEQTKLKSNEQQLNQDFNENPVLVNKFKRHQRVQTAKYKEFVPSPVKSMMNSPFKCLEVQQFQEFMMNSINRYGGWDEYHHNIFVNQWLKNYGPHLDDYLYLDGSGIGVENFPVLDLFINELLPKLPDKTEEEIISHVKWYSKFIYLKDRQQKAIDKWRSNRTIMKSAKVDPDLKKKDCKMPIGRKNICGSVDNNSTTNTVSDELIQADNLETKFSNLGKVSSFARKCLSSFSLDLDERDSKEKFSTTNSALSDIKNKKRIHFQKSTIQWNNKIVSKNDIIDTNYTAKQNNLENMKTRGIPTWRAGLYKI